MRGPPIHKRLAYCISFHKLRHFLRMLFPVLQFQETGDSLPSSWMCSLTFSGRPSAQSPILQGILKVSGTAGFMLSCVVLTVSLQTDTLAVLHIHCRDAPHRPEKKWDPWCDITAIAQCQSSGDPLDNKDSVSFFFKATKCALNIMYHSLSDVMWQDLRFKRYIHPVFEPLVLFSWIDYLGIHQSPTH